METLITWIKTKLLSRKKANTEQPVKREENGSVNNI